MDIKQLHQDFCLECELENLRPSTMREHRHVFAMFIAKTNVQQLADVTPQVVRRFFAWGYQERHWKTHTRIDYRKVLIRFFNWCIERGYLEKEQNPVKNGFKKPRLETREPRTLSCAECEELLTYVYNYPYQSDFVRLRNCAILATFIYTGLRRSELLNLQLRDIDMQEERVFVNQGKGAKDASIPLAPQLKIILKDYLAQRNRLKKTSPEFFVSYTHNKGFSTSGLGRLIRNVRQETGIYFAAHMLRATFATLLSDAGVDMREIQALMRHNSITVTERYVAKNVAKQREAVNRHPMRLGNAHI